jgi:drug/metabolite transporter (DMT)-like permease
MNAILQLVDLNKKAGQWIILSILALIWGSSFILMKRGLMSFSFTQVAAMRIFISFLLLSPSIIKRIGRVKRKHLKSLIIVGVFGNAIPAFLFTKAQTEVSSSIAGVLNALTPLFALVVGIVIYKLKFIWHNIFGIALGLLGAASLVILRSGFGISPENIYPLFIVLATIFYAISINEIKQNLHDLDAVTIIAMAFLFVGPFGGIYLFNSDFTAALNSPDFIRNFACIFILAAFGSAIATILFNYLIKHTNALFASSSTYLIPVVAIFWGLMDGESLLLGQVPAIFLILMGIYLVNKKSNQV